MGRKLRYEEIKAFQQEMRGKNQTFPVCALLENIRSLYNVGSIFRTADATGLERLYLTGYTGTPPRKEIDKTALGSTESVDWKQFDNPLECVEKLKSEGYTIIACEHTDDALDYRSIEYSSPCCLMFGNEVEGISDELCEQADVSMLIPMYGSKESLNVSVAFGVAAYNAVHAVQNRLVSHGMKE